MQSLSRRQFLFVALGIGAAGLTGGTYELLSHPAWMHALGIENSPDFLVPDGQVKTEAGSLRSKYVSGDVRWRLSLPAQTPLATVFCMHGRGGNHNKPFDSIHLQDMVALQNLPLAIVGVDGGEHSYWHKRADGTDRMAMVIEELMPAMEQKTGTAKRALYGWSMGGYGVLLANKTYPDMFDAVVALSPALWVKPGDSAPGAFDSPDDFKRHDVFPDRSQLDASKIRISCAKNDPFFASTKTFASQLQGAQLDFGDGFHDAAYWRSVSPAALSFITTKVSA